MITEDIFPIHVQCMHTYKNANDGYIVAIQSYEEIVARRTPE